MTVCILTHPGIELLQFATLGIAFHFMSSEIGALDGHGQGTTDLGRPAAMHVTPVIISLSGPKLCTPCIAKHFGHAPVATKVLSTRAYEKPGWHYESRKNFHPRLVHVRNVLQYPCRPSGILSLERERISLVHSASIGL